MRLFVLLICLTSLIGCANKKSLYFGTYTRVGIDASTDGAGIGVKNGALNIAPTNEEGQAFDVLGSSDIDTAYTNVVISEIVAIGDAAKCAAQKKGQNKRSIDSFNENTVATGPLIFGAYSSWSLLDLSWGQGTSTGINFGYKRGVGVKVPIINDTVGSAYAAITVNTTEEELDSTTGVTIPKSNIGGTRSTYVFATGNAAIIKASNKAGLINGNDQEYVGCLADTIN